MAGENEKRSQQDRESSLRWLSLPGNVRGQLREASLARASRADEKRVTPSHANDAVNANKVGNGVFEHDDVHGSCVLHVVAVNQLFQKRGKHLDVAQVLVRALLYKKKDMTRESTESMSVLGQTRTGK